jgi:hypothetical protein
VKPSNERADRRVIRVRVWTCDVPSGAPRRLRSQAGHDRRLCLRPPVIDESDVAAVCAVPDCPDDPPWRMPLARRPGVRLMKVTQQKQRRRGRAYRHRGAAVPRAHAPGVHGGPAGCDRGGGAAGVEEASGRSRKGKFQLKRKSRRDRLRAKLSEIKEPRLWRRTYGLWVSCRARTALGTHSRRPNLTRTFGP